MLILSCWSFVGATREFTTTPRVAWFTKKRAQRVNSLTNGLYLSGEDLFLFPKDLPAEASSSIGAAKSGTGMYERRYS